MKIRWREHELVLVTILATAELANILMSAYHSGYEEIRQLTERFNQAVLPFDYTRNVLLPKTGSVLMIFGAYLFINLAILPLIRKIRFDDIEKIVSRTVAIVLALMATLAFLLAIGANALSHLGRPDFFNYADYGILAKFGYNDQPLTDLFFGYQRSIIIVAIMLAFAGLRELAITIISRPGPLKAFRINITNSITLLIFLYVIILLLINPKHHEFLQSLFFGGMALAYYLYTTYWLFPEMGEKTFRDRSTLIRLLAASFLAVLPVSIFFMGKWIVFYVITWAFTLFIITPVFWLIFQWRKDNIMALRGVSEELAHSTADLQFLRAQINPHFLFNALNTLYGTALLEHADRTAQGIQKLGDMMRFVLHESNNDYISMEKETAYLANFIELQKLRLQTSPGIEIEDNIEESHSNQQIAPMLLISLVENAFKHGISMQERSWIRIKLECSPNTIFLEVKNSIHKNNGEQLGEDNSGIGLANVKERLSLLYPNRHELYIHQDEQEFIARLLLKAKTTNPYATSHSAGR